MNLWYSNSLPKQYKHIGATQIFRTSSGSTSTVVNILNSYLENYVGYQMFD